MIELITSLGYDIVEASWHSAALLSKFYLLTVLIRLRDNLDRETVQETLLDESKIVVGLFVLVGVFSLLSGIEVRPVFALISEGIALVYLGFLFWEF